MKQPTKSEPVGYNMPYHEVKGTAEHEISNDPHQYISESEIKSTNHSMAGGKMVTPDDGFMKVRTQGSKMPSAGSKEG